MRTLPVHLCLLSWASLQLAAGFTTPFPPNMQHQLHRQVHLYFPQPTQQQQLLLQRLVVLDASSDDTDSRNIVSTLQPSRLRRWRKRLSKFGKGLLLASTLTFGGRVKPAEAKFSYEIREERKYSIRPGASLESAEKMAEGDIEESEIKASTIFDEKSSTSNSPASAKKATSSFDYGEEDEDDFDDFLNEEPTKAAAPSAKVSKSNMAVAERVQANTRTTFSGTTTGKSKALYLKVSVGLFIPTWGAMGVREFVRRRKEETYVKKGLEILAAQKAEYFNVTETTPDSDIEDELKDLKDSDDDDDDDDHDDDDDDDDEEEDRRPPPRKGPKKPSGDGSGGSSGGDGGDPGYGRPSDDDLKKLGDLFNKS